MAKNTLENAGLKKIEKNCWEFSNKSNDFHITKTGKTFIIDKFNSKIKNQEKAYIESVERSSEKDLFDYLNH